MYEIHLVQDSDSVYYFNSSILFIICLVFFLNHLSWFHFSSFSNTWRSIDGSPISTRDSDVGSVLYAETIAVFAISLSSQSSLILKTSTVTLTAHSLLLSSIPSSLIRCPVILFKSTSWSLVTLHCLNKISHKSLRMRLSNLESRKCPYHLRIFQKQMPVSAFGPSVNWDR